MSADLVLMLTLATAGGLLGHLLRLPALVGFLAAGFVLAALGVEGGATLETMADLGVVLLLFAIGLTFDVRVLLRREVIGVATLHILLSTAVALGLLSLLALAGVALFADASLQALLLVGLALSFSSTVVAVKVLETHNATRSLHGRTAIGILVVQDLVAVVVLGVVEGNPPSWWAALLILLVPLTRPLGRLLDRLDHGELLPLIAVVLALLPGYALFAAVGLKGDLGALVVGVLLASSPRADEMAKSIFAVKELLLVAFFLSVGLHGTPGLRELGLAVALLAIVAVKAALFVLLLRAGGLRVRTATHTADALATFSEFALIVVVAGASAGVLEGDWLIVLATTVAMSFVLSTALGRGVEPLSMVLSGILGDPRDERLHPEERPIDFHHADALVLGMGRLGRAACRRLSDAYGLHVVGVDTDEVRVRHLRAEGIETVEGDATDRLFWERVTAEGTVELVVLAMPWHGSNVAALEQLERSDFDGSVTAVTRFDEQAAHLTHGAGVVGLYDAAGAQLADRAVLSSGLGRRGAAGEIN